MNAEETKKIGDWLRGLFPMSTAEQIAYTMERAEKFSYAAAYRAIDSHRQRFDFINPAILLAEMKDNATPSLSPEQRRQAEFDAAKIREFERKKEALEREEEYRGICKEFSALTSGEFERGRAIAMKKHPDLPMWGRPREQMGIASMLLILKVLKEKVMA